MNLTSANFGLIVDGVGSLGDDIKVLMEVVWKHVWYLNGSLVVCERMVESLYVSLGFDAMQRHFLPWFDATAGAGNRVEQVVKRACMDS